MADILGCDPGAKGGFAVIRDGELYDLHDMPSLIEAKGKSRLLRVSPELTALMVRALLPLDQAYIELVASMPKQGISSAFTFGRAFGVVVGVLAANRVPITYLRPQEWRTMAGVKRSTDLKAGSQARALQLFPQKAEDFRLKKHEGRWEAALIAYAGSRQHDA